jgi:hypothetical protein
VLSRHGVDTRWRVNGGGLSNDTLARIWAEASNFALVELR